MNNPWLCHIPLLRSGKDAQGNPYRRYLRISILRTPTRYATTRRRDGARIPGCKGQVLTIELLITLGKYPRPLAKGRLA